MSSVVRILREFFAASTFRKISSLPFFLGGFMGYQRRKTFAEREIGSAEDEAKRIVNEAPTSASVYTQALLAS